MTLQLPLARNRFATFVSDYSPTLDSSDDMKDRFYDTLYSTLRRLSQDDKIILLGDFNARVGRNHDIWHGVIGHHPSGLRMLSLCSEFGLAVTNTFFQLRDMHKTSWMHPRSKHWHLIDYVIVRHCDLNEEQITRAMRGAECSTDHRLISSTLRLNVGPPARRQKPMYKLNVHAAHNQNIREELHNAIDQSLSHISTTTTLNCTSNLKQIIFNLLLVTITLVSHRDLQSSDCVGIEYRPDGGLFILRCLHAKNKTSSAVISAFQYSNEAAFPSLTADGLQRCLDFNCETYLRAGLIINATKI